MWSVDDLAIAGHAPLHAAVRAAFGDASLPDHLAFAIGIERIDHPGFLASQEQVAFRATSIAEEPKSKSGPRSSSQFGHAAGEDILWRHLSRPHYPARREIHRQHGVARVGGGLGIVVAGGDI